MVDNNYARSFLVNRICVSNALSVLRHNSIYTDKWADKYIACLNMLADLEMVLSEDLNKMGVKDVIIEK